MDKFSARGLTADRLKSLLRYEPESGLFIWATKRRGPMSIGDHAGTVNADGYVIIKIDYKYYLAHRLAWFYMIGEWPHHEVDHKNTNRCDNSFGNLRKATRMFNSQNRRVAQKNNKTGFLGVNKDGNRFSAQICVRGKDMRLGSFATAQLAHAAYVIAKRKYHEGCTL